jgi:phospholipase/carboxylesterase
MKLIEYSPKEKITHSVICLHGLGANGDDLYPLAQQLNLPGVRFVFPNAPHRPVTCNQGYVMPAWFDIQHFDVSRRYECDEVGIDASCQTVRELLANEQARYGISPQNIFLMGFSQGGSVVLEVGLHSQARFAGIIGLSTLPAKADKTFEGVSQASQQTPIFLAHGHHDDILPFNMAEQTHSRLKALDCAVTWKAYNMRHEICLQELQDLRAWIISFLG